MKWVRPFLAVVAALGVTAGFFMDKIEPKEYLVIMSVVITWWFTARDNDKQTPPGNGAQP